MTCAATEWAVRVDSAGLKGPRRLKAALLSIRCAALGDRFPLPHDSRCRLSVRSGLKAVLLLRSVPLASWVAWGAESC